MDEHFKAEGCLYWTWRQLSYFDYFWMSVSLCFLKSSLFCPACLFRTLFLHSVCLVSPSLEILSVTIFKVKLKFSVREKDTWERLSVSLTIKRPFSLFRPGSSNPRAVRGSALCIWFLLGFLCCCFRILCFQLSYIIAVCPPVLQLKHFWLHLSLLFSIFMFLYYFSVISVVF